MDKKPFFTFLNSKSTLRNVFSDRMKMYRHVLPFVQEVVREPSHLSPADREIIAAFTSHLNSCRLCTGSHSAFALTIGAEVEQLHQALADDYAGTRLESILDYVKKLTLLPSSLTSGDYEAVIASGFTEEELKDAIAVCVAFNMFNRIIEGYGLLDNPEFRVASGAEINKYGYDFRYMKNSTS